VATMKKGVCSNQPPIDNHGGPSLEHMSWLLMASIHLQYLQGCFKTLLGANLIQKAREKIRIQSKNRVSTITLKNRAKKGLKTYFFE